MKQKSKRKFNFRIGIPTIAALVIAAAILITFASPLKYEVETDSSDFDSLSMFNCDVVGNRVTFELPDATLFEKTTLTIDVNDKGELLTDIDQVKAENNSSLFLVAGTNIKVDDDTAYVIITGYRQFIFSGPPESYGFAVRLVR